MVETRREPPAGRRLLVLAPFPPRLDATHGGSRMVAQLVAGLTARHRVAVLALRAAGEPPLDEALAARCELALEVERPVAASPTRRLLRRTRLGAFLLAGRPLQVTRWAVPAYAARVRELAGEWRPDVVQIEYPVMGQYLPALAACPAPRVLTAYEPGAGAARDLWRSQRGVARGAARLDLLAWRRFERRVLDGVQTVVALTRSDCEALAELGAAAPIATIPLGITLPERPLSPTGSTTRASLLFVGNFLHPPNVDAAVRLAADVFPEVRKRHPGAFLHIVGDQPPPEVRRLAGASVSVAGLVPDLVPYLERAALVVAPLRLGGGMRVKVLEALAAGKAVVASPLAVAGLDVRDGEHLALAESDEELCERIVQLLAQPEERAAIATRARAWAIANLGPERTVEAYERLYEELLGERSPSAAPLSELPLRSTGERYGG